MRTCARGWVKTWRRDETIMESNSFEIVGWTVLEFYPHVSERRVCYGKLRCQLATVKAFVVTRRPAKEKKSA